VQLLGGPPEMQLASDCDERLQLAQFHPPIISGSDRIDRPVRSERSGIATFSGVRTRAL
jgi:hypothetical protein